MSSKCTNDGQMYLDVTFKLGTNLDMAQVLVQNRVAIAEAKLPEEVKRQGVTTKKKSPSILLCVNLISPDDSRYDQLYLSNYATHPGEGRAGPPHGRRRRHVPRRRATTACASGSIPSKLAVAQHDRRRRDQGAPRAERAGRRRPPRPAAGARRASTSSTRSTPSAACSSPKQFGDDHRQDRRATAQVTRRRATSAGVELGAKNYDVNSYLDGQPSVTLAVFQLPGSNALADRRRASRAEMERAEDDAFPTGVDYRIVYDTTVFVDESIHEVYKTLFEAFVLVFIVVLVFLQNWRATLMPMIAVPVSLIGTFAVMALLGFSLNNLSLFGLVLAIGIVVDDAIVVVENVERWMAKGLSPREATRQGDGRDHRAGHRHHAGAELGVHPDGVHRRHQRPVLSGSSR